MIVPGICSAGPAGSVPEWFEPHSVKVVHREPVVDRKSSLKRRRTSPSTQRVEFVEPQEVQMLLKRLAVIVIDPVMRRLMEDMALGRPVANSALGEYMDRLKREQQKSFLSRRRPTSDPELQCVTGRIQDNIALSLCGGLMRPTVQDFESLEFTAPHAVLAAR